EEGRFRKDLYCRLSVFPISVPALRERAEDIPGLIQHFIRKYARQLNKRIEVVSDEVMEAMVKYPWPGNIAELKKFIERAVMLSCGPALDPPLWELTPSHAAGSAAQYGRRTAMTHR